MTTPTSKPGRRKPACKAAASIPDKVYFRIGEVAELLDVKPHVLRYWETEFKVVAPGKSASGQRVYRRADVETLVTIKRLLHEEKYSIQGARKRLATLRRKQERGRDPVLLAGLMAQAEELVRLAGTPISRLFRY